MESPVIFRVTDFSLTNRKEVKYPTLKHKKDFEMGMLLAALGGAAKAGSEIMDRRIKEISDDELLNKKNAMEIEREKRIEEAQGRAHDKLRSEQLADHDVSRSEKASDTTDQRAYEVQTYDKKLGDNRADSETEFGRKKGMLSEERAYNEPVRNATLQNMGDTHSNNQLSQRDAENKLELQEKITDLNKEFINATPERQDELRPVLNAMHGKYEKYAMVNQKTYEGGMVTGETSVPWNTATGELKSEESTKAQSKVSSAIKSIAKNAIIGSESSGNPEAQNEKSTAGGLGQMLDGTAKAYGAKVGADGKISYEEKNKAFDKFFNSNYERFDGNIPQVLAAQFGQEGIAESVRLAQEKGGNWTDYAKKYVSPENMAVVENNVTSIKRAISEKGGAVPSSLLTFVNPYRQKS
jgi:hypothetical protein